MSDVELGERLGVSLRMANPCKSREECEARGRGAVEGLSGDCELGRGIWLCAPVGQISRRVAGLFGE